MLATDFIFLLGVNLASSILVGPVGVVFGLWGSFVNSLFGL